MRWTQFKIVCPVPVQHGPAPSHLQYDSQDTCDNPEQCHTFHEGCSQDHVRADVTGSFRLAGDAFYSTAANLSDTHTGTQSSETGTNSATGTGEAVYGIYVSNVVYCLKQNCV